MGNTYNCRVQLVDNTMADQGLFRMEYLAEQRARLRFLDANNLQLVLNDRDDHEAEAEVFGLAELFEENIVKRLDNATLARLATLCKKWGNMFVLGKMPPTWQEDYENSLQFDHNNGVCTVKRNGALVGKYCLCQFMEDPVGRDVFHARQLLYQLQMEYAELSG